MKTRMPFGLSLAILNAATVAAALITAMPGQAVAQPTSAASQPSTSTVLTVVDPATGLPLAGPESKWKDPQWKDPEKVLKQVTYDGAPISEVVRNLRDQFDSAFDF